MELKVWVDDIQRIVRGVNPSTTCHDVVLALAVATGQTGRFTLIEKFQNNERLLSPSEKPFQILNKWAGYASDVQFIMKKSTPNLNTSSNCDTNSTPSLPVDSLRTNKTRLDCRMKHKLSNCNNNNNEAGAKVTISSVNTRKKIGSPSLQSSMNSSANTSQTFISSPANKPDRHTQDSNDLKSFPPSILESLQSSGLSLKNLSERNGQNRDYNGNTQSPCSSNHHEGNQRVRSPITNSGSKCILSQTHISRASIPLKLPQKSIVDSLPGVTRSNFFSNENSNYSKTDSPRYVSRIELPVGKSAVDESIEIDRKLVSPRKGPRFAKLVEQVYDKSNSDDIMMMNQAHFPIHHQTSLSLNSRPRNPPTYNEALQRGSIYSSTSSSPSPCFQGPDRVVADFDSPLKQVDCQEVGATGRMLPVSPVRPSRKLKVPKVVFSPSQKTVTGSSSKLSSSSNNKIDPLRLMSTMQRNALIEEEIVESVELHEPQLKESILMKSKMKEMEKAWEENEAELEALEIEFKNKRERDLKNKEIFQLKEQSRELESKISFSRHQIQLLTDQIREEEHKLEMNLRKAEVEEEKKIREMIEKLKNDIQAKEQEFDDQDQLKQLDGNIKELDQQLNSKTMQVDVILGDIKQENLAGLSVEPSIQLQLLTSQLSNDSVVAKLHSEVTKGPASTENYFYNRIGSTRKMLGYPRELETAVATMKNPNGVWV